MSRYREKRKSIMKFGVKADYSFRREITSRIARSRGKIVLSDKTPDDELQSCANCVCGESSEVTPRMRRGPNGVKNFCNACGLAWAAQTRKIRKLTNAESSHGGGQ